MRRAPSNKAAAPAREAPPRHVLQTDRLPNIVGHPLVAVHSRTSVRQLSHDLFGGISTIEEKSKAAKPLQVNRHFCSEPMSFSNSLSKQNIGRNYDKENASFRRHLPF